MPTPPFEAILLGAGFVIVGMLTLYGGLKMGSGLPMLAIGAGAVLGGLGLAATGLARWLWARLRR